MAKRRRLTPARGLELGPDGPRPPSEAARFARETATGDGPAEAKSAPPARPPIADMAGDIVTRAAANEMANVLHAARAEGRLAEAVPLEAVVADHIIRDRGALDEDEMAALMRSLRARGQQVPIEVLALENGRYGLISGWRRLEALRRLSREADGPTTIMAVLRAPGDLAETYLAMVEENEIRADLSFWERGRIVERAVTAGVFPDRTAALTGLFGTVSRAKRSKIGSFATLVRHLDGVLRFPQALGERAGLALALRVKAAEETGGDALEDVRADLAAALTSADSPEDERAAIAAWTEADRPAPMGGEPPSSTAKQVPRPTEKSVIGHGLTLERRDVKGRGVELRISGSRVDETFHRRLKAWLASEM
ncbi:MAG: ParB N-terminal domain-containing protein [Pseudomonadota bacterium]